VIQLAAQVGDGQRQPIADVHHHQPLLQRETPLLEHALDAFLHQPLRAFDQVTDAVPEVKGIRSIMLLGHCMPRQ
jgi:hypothetical protein